MSEHYFLGSFTEQVVLTEEILPKHWPKTNFPDSMTSA
jgi:hypothetical protein